MNYPILTIGEHSAEVYGASLSHSPSVVMLDKVPQGWKEGVLKHFSFVVAAAKGKKLAEVGFDKFVKASIVEGGERAHFEVIKLTNWPGSANKILSAAEIGKISEECGDSLFTISFDAYPVEADHG